MPDAASLVVRVSTEGVEAATRQLGEMGKKVDESKGHFDGLKNALSTAGGFAIFGAGMAGFDFLKGQIGSVLKDTEDYQQITADTTNTLQHMGKVSGQTAQSISEYADKMSHATMFTADATQKAENLMLTFAHIGKEVFPQATTAALNMSQKLGQDLQSSVIQVGKALDNPITGFSALQRVGVSFSEEEKKQIKTMQAHNDLMGAQKIILSELNKQFGGDAVTAGKQFGGQMAIMNNQFEDMKIKIGGALLPVLSDLMHKYVVPLAGQFQDWMNKGGGLRDFQGWIQTASGFLQNQLLPSLNTMLNQYIIPLGQSFYDLFIKSGFAQGVLSEISTIFQDVAPLIGGVVKGITGLIEGLSKGGPGAEVAKDALIGIGIAIAGFKTAQGLVDLNKGIGTVITNVGNMKNTFSSFLDWFGGTFGSGIKRGAAEDAASVESIGSAAKTAEADTALASGEMDAELGGVAIAARGAAGAEGVGGLTAAVGGLFNLLGPVLGLALLGEQLSIAIPLATGKANDPARNPNSGGHIQNYHGPHGFASGVINNQEPGWHMVGERGSEMMFVPQGASILPHGMSPSSGGGQQNIHVDVYLDGDRMGQRLMGPIVNSIRNATGVRF